MSQLNEIQSRLAEIEVSQVMADDTMSVSVGSSRQSSVNFTFAPSLPELVVEGPLADLLGKLQDFKAELRKSRSNYLGFDNSRLQIAVRLYPTDN
jgi:hypothetical protein